MVPNRASVTTPPLRRMMRRSQGSHRSGRDGIRSPEPGDDSVHRPANLRGLPNPGSAGEAPDDTLLQRRTCLQQQYQKESLTGWGRPITAATQRGGVSQCPRNHWEGLSGEPRTTQRRGRDASTRVARDGPPRPEPGRPNPRGADQNWIVTFPRHHTMCRFRAGLATRTHRPTMALAPRDHRGSELSQLHHRADCRDVLESHSSKSRWPRASHCSWPSPPRLCGG